jgi:RNA polymerase sigma-70 factor (ECF subfamily)
MPRLTPETFAKELSSAHRAVWTIAVAILHDRAAADDTIQEAAAIALSKLGEFDTTTSFVAWFGQIVRFTALNEGRRRQRAQAGKDAAPESPVGRPPATAAFDARLQAALAGLDDTARTCLLMRTVHDMTYAEIARALGIPEGTAMSHVHRARIQLRERLAPGEGRSPP